MGLTSLQIASLVEGEPKVCVNGLCHHCQTIHRFKRSGENQHGFPTIVNLVVLIHVYKYNNIYYICILLRGQHGCTEVVRFEREKTHLNA